MKSFQDLQKAVDELRLSVENADIEIQASLWYDRLWKRWKETKEAFSVFRGVYDGQIHVDRKQLSEILLSKPYTLAQIKFWKEKELLEEVSGKETPP